MTMPILQMTTTMKKKITIRGLENIENKHNIYLFS